MFEYDATLKVLLKGSAETAIRLLFGNHVSRWLNVELLNVEVRRLDLLAEADDGCLLHIELQSENDPLMAPRMMEYGAKVALRDGRYPKQVVLYVGEASLRMAGDYYANGELVFRYKVVDMRDLDGQVLLESDGLGDNVLAILARLRDEREAVRRIVGRIARLNASERQSMLEQLSILAGLRQLEPLVKEEANRMPITENILNHQLIGPAYRKGQQEGLKEGRREGREEGRHEGREEGRHEGRQEGELTILRRLISKRFGAIPNWLEERLTHSSADDLELLSERVLDARTLDDLLK